MKTNEVLVSKETLEEARAKYNNIEGSARAEFLEKYLPLGRELEEFGIAEVAFIIEREKDKTRAEAETELLKTLEKKISKGGDCDCGYEIYLLQKKARGET